MGFVEPVVGDTNSDKTFYEVIRTHGNDVIAEFFDVSLTTLKDIDDFTKDLEMGKYTMWSKLSSDNCKEVLANISTRWNAIVAAYENQ
ncbi:hypothetical protein Tco_0968621 [Tanacetum coccineum]